MSIQAITEKWEPVLKASDNGIKPVEGYKARVTAQILENTEAALREDARNGQMVTLSEAPANAVGDMSTGNVKGYDPVLISLVRRAMPNLMAYDIAGVQPMTGPTGLIFAMRSKYTSQTGAEAFYNEANTAFTGTGSHAGSPFPANFANAAQWSTGSGMTTAAAEALGDGVGGGSFQEMAFSIEKVQVGAKSRALKAEYTTELAQDLKAIHGLDAETELANMLQAELLAEINRELVRTVYTVATVGAQTGTAVAGTFDLDVDANGRWSVEKFKGLMFHIEREANQIAKDTRRGKGNIIICSSDVASALQMAGVLDYTPALNSNALNVDDTGNTFVGVLNGRFRVYIDPYAGSNFLVVGYKGASAWDAGLFYCPYVPLQMVRAVGENSFQSKLGFKTRYGMIANPFAEGATVGNGALNANANKYYRKVGVLNIL